MINEDDDPDQEIYDPEIYNPRFIAVGRNFDFSKLIEHFDFIMEENIITRDGLMEVINVLSDKNAVYEYYPYQIARLYETFAIPLEHKCGRFEFKFDKLCDIKYVNVLTGEDGYYCQIDTFANSNNFFTTVWGKSIGVWDKLYECRTL